MNQTAKRCNSYRGNLLRLFLTALVLTQTALVPTFAGEQPVATSKPEPGSLWRSLFRNYQMPAGDAPRTEVAAHVIGNMQVGHTNLGQFGTGFIGGQNDPVTGEQIPSATFPANSSRNYLYIAAFWIGAIIGRDTLVSSGADDGFAVHEFWPSSHEGIERRSINTESEFFSEEAKSEQDIIAIYYDTLDDPGFTSTDAIDNRRHQPLGIKVVERSLQWSYEYAADFILFDYDIINIGRKRLDQVYMGIYVDGDVHHFNKSGDAAYGDDICGFKKALPIDCDFLDTVNLAYIMDNNGDPDPGAWNKSESVRDVAGVRLIRTPSDSLEFSFNWWSAAPGPDFGPRKAETQTNPWRDMNGYLGAPHGDKNKYYMLSNNEIDYDQLTMAVDQSKDGWLPPSPDAQAFALGGDPKFMLSFGPFNIFPGEKLPVTFAYLGGRNFHRGPDDFNDLFSTNPGNPTPYYNSLDFTSFGANARWASWIYDNPCVDSDSDGFGGVWDSCFSDTSVRDTAYDTIVDTLTTPPDTTVDTVIFNPTFIDTICRGGDGIPDFRGASPPPAPTLRVTPETGKLTIGWNGFRSENTPDPFSDEIDFEGYRVYMSKTSERSQFVIQTTFDHENYNRFVYNAVDQVFELKDLPFSLAELRALYGPGFNPGDYGAANPLRYHHSPTGTDSLYYFAPQDWNRDELNTVGAIRTVYDRSQLTIPSANPDDWTADELTAEGLPKYYEYEFTLENLLPSIPVYVSVTAFDYGSPSSGLKSLESSPLFNAVQEFPLTPTTVDPDEPLDVIVFPNPYRIDGDYRSVGYEGYDNDYLSDERVRAVNFVNLPYECTISIFSLDGDLIRSIEHKTSPGEARASHNRWDLISRNTQPVTSGIYYFVVEDTIGRTQIGKIVIIK